MLRLMAVYLLAAIAAISWTAWPQPAGAVTAGQAAPEIAGENWLNSEPLTIGALRGRVVLVEFWTYG